MEKLAAVVLLLALGACGGSPPSVDETLAASVRTVESGAEALRQGVGKVGHAATGGLIGKLESGRERESMRREARDMVAHLEGLERFLREREIALRPEEIRRLQAAKDDLAAAARRLASEGFAEGEGARIYLRLDAARTVFDLFTQRYGAIPYSGHIAVR